MLDHEEIKSTKEIIAKRKDGRRNNGRPRGSMNKATMEMKVAKKAFTDRVNKNVDRLFNAQLSLALGEKYLMVIRTEGEGKNRKRWTEIIEDPEIIKQYLDEELDDDDEHFYYMTTKPASNQAIDSLLNRSFGKARESLDLTSGDEPIRGATIVFADKPETDSSSPNIP